MKRVLIANRGEIACRVIRACKEAGLTAIAVCSEADIRAAHAEAADECVVIGPAPARQSYLDSGCILAAATDARADAIHPGYGFLSENADFARAVEAAGLIWIGPSPDSIANMGDKERARAIAAEAGVPILPGSVRFAVGALDGLALAAERIGYPLLVKAAGGGGGIGMRRVDHAGDLTSTAASTQALAERLFGNGSIYLERLVAKARHIEVQVFGDGCGEVVHLHERDCSIQRRYQKVVEESPAPGAPAHVRQAMFDCALNLARAQNYAGAGTIEFLVDAQSWDFYFLEMNTRIQVEHPVTEMVTGADIVRMQLDLARGAPLMLATPALEGCAIECRLYAENPSAGFRPSPGKLQNLVLPVGEDVRIESGYRSGDTVTPFYDPLLAKIICRGSTRRAAIATMRQALERTHVEGVVSNLGFLRKVLANPAFLDGDIDTHFLEIHERDLVEGAGVPPPLQTER